MLIAKIGHFKSFSRFKINIFRISVETIKRDGKGDSGWAVAMAAL